MSTFVSINTYTHSVTYVTENILRSLQDIVKMSGLDPDKISSQWETLENGIRTWLDSRHLEKVVLEVYNPLTDKLIARWDIEIAYDWDGDSGRFWVDTEQIKMAIKKAGVWPYDGKYRIVCSNKDGRPHVFGWSSTTLRSTAGMIQQSIGTTVEHNGLGASASYYRERP
jgi:HORMA domain-containing protein